MKKIDPRKWYTIKDLHDLGAFPWIGSYQSYWNFVKRDMAGDNRLGAKLVAGTRGHFIEGDKVIKLVKEMYK